MIVDYLCSRTQPEPALSMTAASEAAVDDPAAAAMMRRRRSLQKQRRLSGTDFRIPVALTRAALAVRYVMAIFMSSPQCAFLFACFAKS
jgi:hypothetical protein